MSDGFNYKFTLSYRGGPFKGWQSQKDAHTVQGVFEEALSRLTQERVTSFAAGRTDQGVHATAQIANVYFSKPYTLDRLRRGTNFYLHQWPLRVMEVESVPKTFHARFSATQRRYCYRLHVNPSENPHVGGQVWWLPRQLNIGAMAQAAGLFEGHHNFSAFRDAECGAASPLKTMDLCRFVHVGDGLFGPEFHLLLAARSFLHHQVRIMMGSLVEVGLGRQSPEWIAHLLKAARPRAESGPTAPPWGLYLTGVGYPPESLRPLV